MKIGTRLRTKSNPVLTIWTLVKTNCAAIQNPKLPSYALYSNVCYNHFSYIPISLSLNISGSFTIMRAAASLRGWNISVICSTTSSKSCLGSGCFFTRRWAISAVFHRSSNRGWVKKWTLHWWRAPRVNRFLEPADHEVGQVASTVFPVFGMTWPGIEPNLPALVSRPSSIN